MEEQPLQQEPQGEEVTSVTPEISPDVQDNFINQPIEVGHLPRLEEDAFLPLHKEY